MGLSCLSALGLTALVLVSQFAALSTPRAQGLIADLSHHLIAITTGFVGSNVLLFGTVENLDSDVAVVVRGPRRDISVRRKSRLGLIWINLSQVEFRAVPEFYAVATSRPLDDLADPYLLRLHEVGVDNLAFLPILDSLDEGEAVEEFREALIRNKQRAGLFPRETARIRFLGNGLFRTTINFPANVPPGTYQVQTFEFEDGVVRSAQTTILTVSKVGMEADIYELANNQAALYGVVSIVVAIVAGWTASLIFRRR